MDKILTHKTRFFLVCTLVFIAFSIAFPGRARAGTGPTITAASCSESDVVTALTSAVSGATVVIPSGTCTWTTPEYYTAPANLTIQGQTVCTGSGAPGQNNLSCTDNTTIVDGTNHASDFDQPMWQITTSAAGTFRITGITFGWGGGQVTDNGTLQFIGGSQQFRMDHVHFDLIAQTPFITSQAIAGVIDHILIDGIAPGSEFRTNGGTPTDFDGHTDWAAPTALGSGNFVFVENSIFNYASNDCFQGSRWVVRYNTFNVGGADMHATGASAGGRGCRAWELYGNQFLSATGSCTATASFNGSATHSALLITEISGVAATNPLDAHSAMNQDQPPMAANAITSGTSTTTHNGDYIWGATVSPNNSYGPVSAGTGFTLSQAPVSGETVGEYELQSAPGPISATFTDTADQYLHIQTFLMALPPAGSVGQPALVQGTTGLGYNTGSDSAKFSSYVTSGDLIAAMAMAQGAIPTNVTSTCSGSFTQVDAVYDGILNATSSDWYAFADATTGGAIPPPPSVPTGVTVTGVTASTASLSWNTSTGGNGLAGYEIFRETLPVGTTTGTSYTDSGLAPNTVYTYTINAYGPQGNASNPSASVSATTLANPDPPPVFILIPANNATLSGTVTVTAAVSSGVGATQVQLYLDGTTLLATYTSAPYTLSWNTTSVANGTHTLTATASDASGNQTTSAAVTITIYNASGGGSISSPTEAQPPSNVFFVSSGTGVVWGNNASNGSYASFVSIHSIRRDNTAHAEVATPNGWGFCGTSFNGTGSNWDQNSNIATGYRCLDQPGQGQGDLLSGDISTADLTNTVTGCTASSPCAWPQEALEPIYEWMDSVNGSQFWNNYEPDALINNSDYYIWCDPLSASGCTTFDGTAGVGSGLLSARPATCTPGVGYWATDQGNWNQSGSGAQGELFVCGPAANTWALHYEPYIYPHPLDASGGSGGTTPPSVPTGLMVTGATTSTVSLSWTASTGSNGVAGYDVYRGGAQVGTAAGTSYTDTGLAANTTYIYTVAAYDGAGNTSNQSASVNGTTSSGAAQTITFNPLSPVTYGVAPITLTATASSGLPVSYTFTGSATLSGSTLTITGAGSVTVTASQAGNTNYAAATPVQQTLTVNKAPLTVTANNAGITTGQPLPSFTYTITAFVNGDTSAVVSGTATETTTATSASPVGTYPITFATESLTAANYTFTYVNGTLTISSSTQTITFNPLTPVTYGVTPITLTATASSGLPVSYTFTGPATLSGSTLTITGAGSVTVTASQAGNTNYAAATPVMRTLTVNKAPLTVTANNAGITTGQPLPSFTYTITAFVNGDTSAVVSGTATETTTATSASPAGTYPITFATESLTAANYTFTYVNGTLTISSAIPPPAFVQGTTSLGFNTNSDSATFTNNVTNGDMIAVMVSAQGAGITNVASSCSGSFTKVDAALSAALNATSADWYAPATSTGPCTVTATLSGSAGHSALLITEISGVAATNPLDAHSAMNQDQPALAANVITSGSATTAHSGDYIWGATVSPNDSYGAVSAGTGFTLSQALKSGETIGEYALQSAAGPVSATFTDTADQYLHVQTFMMAFTPGGGSSTGNTCPQNLAIGSFTLCGESYNDVSSGTNVQVNYTPSPNNGIIAWATWCFTSACNTSIAGVTATIGDNINATESCFAVSPHSPFITDANAGAQGSGDFQQHYVWYCPNIPAGVTSFTVTPSNPNLAYLQLNVSEWKAGSLAASCSPISACFENVDNSSQAGNSTGGTTATITTSGSTVNANDLLFAATEVSCCSFTASPGAGYTGITVAPGVTPGMVSEAKAVTATGLQTATSTWTGGSTPWFGVIVPIKGAGTAQTITFNPLTPVTYGVTPITLTATASSGLPVSYTFTGPATLSGSTLTITGAGSVTVTASQAGNTNYAAATPVQQTLTVNKAPLTVTANNAGMIYGQSLPSFTYAITNFVNGDTSAVVSGTATETTTATSASPVGTYPITFATESLTAANYTFTYVNGTLTISGGAAQTITFNALTPVAYGVTPITLTATASSGLPVSYTFTGPATLSGSTLTITGAGSVTVTASQAGNTNYAAATPVQQTLTVNKAPLTVTANNAGMIYGQSLPSFTYTITNFVNGDTSAVVSGTATETTTATSASPVGTYPITFATESLTAANYTFTYVNGTLTISSATQTITFNALSPVTYGVAPITLTATASSGLPVSYMFTGPATLSGSTLTITGAGSVTVTASQAGNTNYAAATPVMRTLTVNKAPLTVTANNAGITTGQPLPSFTYTITAFVNGDTSAVVSGTATETTTATSASPPGPYPITFATESLAAANYTFTYVNGTLTISSAIPPPAFVQGTTSLGFNSNSDSAKFTNNVTNGDMIAVMVSAQGAGITNVTSSCSGSFTQVDTALSAALNATSADWYAPATSTGPCTVTATLSGSAGHSALLITEISGVATTNPLDAHSAMNQDQPALAANVITSGTSTTVHSGDYIWGATVSPNDSYGAVSAGTGFTLSQALKGGETIGEYELQSAAGPIAATFTDTADQYLHVQTFMMAFVP